MSDGFRNVDLIQVQRFQDDIGGGQREGIERASNIDSPIRIEHCWIDESGIDRRP